LVRIADTIANEIASDSFANSTVLSPMGIKGALIAFDVFNIVFAPAALLPALYIDPAVALAKPNIAPLSALSLMKGRVTSGLTFGHELCFGVHAVMDRIAEAMSECQT